MGRTLSTDDLEICEGRFHEAYAAQLPQVELMPGARDAIRQLSEKQITQSILSMYPHDALVTLVETLGIVEWFECVDGLRPGIEYSKSAYIAAHIEALGVSKSSAALIGDVVDDGEAARSVGIPCVLIATGAESIEVLRTSGWPVFVSIDDAVTHLLH